MGILTISPKLTIHYLDPNPKGEKAVLLLHGLGATGESWQLQAPALIEAGYRPLMPDARGFGKSSYPGGSHSVADMASDMLALLDYLEIPCADVVGISMGGTLAQQLTLDHPRRANSLTLVNTFACLRPDSPKLWWVLLKRMVMVHTVGIDKQAEYVAGKLFPSPEQTEIRAAFQEQVSQANPGGYRAAMRALARFDSRPRLQEIATPTQVITGDQDTTIPPHHQLVLAQGIPKALETIIPGVGHALSVTHPDIFNPILLNWLEENRS